MKSHHAVFETAQHEGATKILMLIADELMISVLAPVRSSAEEGLDKTGHD